MVCGYSIHITMMIKLLCILLSEKFGVQFSRDNNGLPGYSEIRDTLGLLFPLIIRMSIGFCILGTYASEPRGCQDLGLKLGCDIQ